MILRTRVRNDFTASMDTILRSFQSLDFRISFFLSSCFGLGASIAMAREMHWRFDITHIVQHHPSWTLIRHFHFLFFFSLVIFIWEIFGLEENLAYRARYQAFWGSWVMVNFGYWDSDPFLRYLGGLITGGYWVFVLWFFFLLASFLNLNFLLLFPILLLFTFHLSLQSFSSTLHACNLTYHPSRVI